ncbi:MAG: hypothetical protein WC587_00160 [Candidatus Paceibacterota bacterium]
MTKISKDLVFFKQRRANAQKDGYKKPKVLLVDIDGTIIKPKIKMFTLAEEKFGKKVMAEIEKERIRPLRKEMMKEKISFEKYLIELSKINIELGQSYKDYKDFFFGLVKRGFINEPLVRALGNLKRKNKLKVIFLTSNLKIYGEIIADNVLRLLGEKGKFDGCVGEEKEFDKKGKGKATKVKMIISHKDIVYEGVKFMTKITAIKDYFKKNKIKVKNEEVAIISDADTALMKHYGLGGLVLYPWNELSDQFRHIEYVRNARKGLFDFCVDYRKGKDLEIAQRKWEVILDNPNMLKFSDKEIKNNLKNNGKKK